MFRLQGRIALITSAGSARPLASSLASLGATVIVTMPHECDADALARSIAQETGNLRVHGVMIDLRCPFSVRDGASEFIERWRKLHVLVNDTSIPLGPTLLANLLLDTMKQSGRVLRLSIPNTKRQVWTVADAGRSFAKCAS